MSHNNGRNSWTSTASCTSIATMDKPKNADAPKLVLVAVCFGDPMKLQMQSLWVTQEVNRRKLIRVLAMDWHNRYGFVGDEVFVEMGEADGVVM